MPARPLKILLLSSAVALGLSAPAHAAAPSSSVVKVVDGNTVKVREGKRTRSVDLLGLEVPACHAAQAKAALQKLLPAKARVRLVKDGGRTGRYVHRGRTFVNAALLRSGAVQGKDLAALEQAQKLTGAETEAKAAKRGLWTTCAQPQQQPQQAPPPGGQNEQARKDLAGRVFTRITATTFSSTESHLNLCSDGSFIEDVSTFSDFGDPSTNPLPDSDATHQRYQGTWEVVSATYTADSASARVRRANQDGSEGFIDFVATGRGVTVNGFSVSAGMSSTCT
jgi:endonuclease YncB( thermonuclease family)